MAMLTVKRKSYTRADGTHVKGSTFKIKDRGAKGKTPKSKKWYSPKVHSGWSKTLSQKVRIAKVVKAHGGSLLASARSLMALANVTTDIATRQLARKDATSLYNRYAR